MERRYNLYDYKVGQYLSVELWLYQGKYAHLTNNERIVYALLHSHFSLSVKNGWLDNDGFIYFIYDQMKLADDAKISRSTAIRSIERLIDMKLILSVRQGLNKPNKLYLLKPEDESVFDLDRDNSYEQRMCQNETSECVKMKHQEVSKRNTNYLNNSYLKFNTVVEAYSDIISHSSMKFIINDAVASHIDEKNLIKIIEYAKQQNKVKNIVGYIRTLIQEGYDPVSNLEQKPTHSSANKFNNFEQRTYDYKDLEKIIVNN